MMDKTADETIIPMGLDDNMGAIRAIYPIRDALCYVHGATGCTMHGRFFFAWHDNALLRILSSGVEGKHIIFGGEELLEESLIKAVEVTDPKLIVIQNTCIPALVGDDTAQVARRVSERTGVKVLSTVNPNYKGYQLDGYQNVVNAYVAELMQPQRIQKGCVNLLGVMPGEFNWTNSVREAVWLLHELGLEVNCTLVGEETTVKEIIEAPAAQANVLLYPEVGLPAARAMQEQFGIPFIETVWPPVGIEASREWLLTIGAALGREAQAEGVIEREMAEMGQALNRLGAGQMVHLEFLCGKTYALEASPFQVPAMVKFLYEDLGLVPNVVAFQEPYPLSQGRLEAVLKQYDLHPEVQPVGDHRAFQEAITRNHVYPYGDPWVVIGSSIDAFHLSLGGQRLPVMRFSYPVLDEAIVTDRPFVGFRGVVCLAERLHNLFQEKLFYTRYPVGHFPDPYELGEEMTREP